MNRQSTGNIVYKMDSVQYSRQSTPDKMLNHQRTRKSPFRYEPPTLRKPLVPQNVDADHRDELIKHLTNTNQQLLNKLTDTMQRPISQDGYEQDYKALLSQYGRLQEQCETLKQTIQEKHYNMDRQSQQVLLLEKQLSTVEFHKDDQILSLQKQFENTIQSLHKENQDLWQKLQDSSSMYLQYEREVKQLNENIVHISDENLQLMNSLQKLQDQYNAKETDYKRIDAQLNEVRATHKDQQTAWEQSATGRTRDFLKRREDEWEEIRLKMQESIEQLGKDKDRLDMELTKINHSIVQERMQSQTQLKHLRTQNSELQDSVDQLNKQVEAARLQNEALNDQLLQNSQTFGRERTYFEQQNKQQKTKINEISAQEKHLAKQLQTLTEELNDKVEQIASIQVQFTKEKEQLGTLLSKLENKYNGLQISHQNLESIRDSQSNEIAALNQKITNLMQLEKVIEQLKTQRLDQQLDYEEQIKELTSQHIRDTATNKQLYEARLTSAEEEITSLEEQLQERDKHVQQLENRINTLNEELEEHEEAHLSTSQEHDKWKKKFQEGHVPIAEYQNLQSSLNNKGLEAKTYKDRAETAESELSRLRKEIAGYEEELDRRKLQLVEAEELQIKRRRENDQVLLQNENLKRDITKLQMTLQQLQNQMSEHTMAFSSTQQNFESDLKHAQSKIQLLEGELQSKSELLRQKTRELEDLRFKSSEDQMKQLQNRSASQRAGRESMSRSSIMRQ